MKSIYEPTARMNNFIDGAIRDRMWSTFMVIIKGTSSRRVDDSVRHFALSSRSTRFRARSWDIENLLIGAKARACMSTQSALTAMSTSLVGARFMASLSTIFRADRVHGFFLGMGNRVKASTALRLLLLLIIATRCKYRKQVKHDAKAADDDNFVLKLSILCCRRPVLCSNANETLKSKLVG
jgi:hypothetical protein